MAYRVESSTGDVLFIFRSYFFKPTKKATVTKNCFKPSKYFDHAYIVVFIKDNFNQICLND